MEKSAESLKHKKMNLSDKIWQLGELEHLRRHARRSAKVAKDEDEKLFWNVIALQSKKIRRDFQKEYLDTDDLSWCPEKVAASLKQLNYECEQEGSELFDRIENLCDMVLSHALGEDLYSCESCAKDAAGID